MPDIARIMRYTMEMDAPLVTRPLVGTLQCTDKKADTIQLAITSGGVAVSLAGSSAVGLFRRPMDGTQVRCPGTISGGIVTVPLLDQCYMYAGDFDLLIKLTGSGVERTVLRISGYVEAGGDGVIVDPSGSIPSYDDLAETIESANTAAANANAKATAANSAAENASAKATEANNAASAANTAASNANTKATAADTAAGAANTAAAKINNMTVAATGLAAGATPTATVSEASGHKHIAFGIPKGDKGDVGATPALSIGTVTTGAPGTQASATMGGTTAAPVLNLVIPRGDAGQGAVSTVDSIQPVSGNVSLGAVRYNAAQTLTDSQKQQARQNIGALGGGDVVDSLTSDDATKPLSAKQGKALKALIDVIPVADGAGAHNAIYRGASLGTSVTAEQWAAIGNGTFTGLYIGDYWTISNIVYRIAAFDYYYNRGNTTCTTHHAVIVPDATLDTQPMNDTDVISGAYVGSKLYTEGLAQAKAIITSAFGSAHILSHSQYLHNAVTGGYTSGGAWYDSTADLMNEINVYGTIIYGNCTNGGNFPNNITLDNSRYPLFAFAPKFVMSQESAGNGSYWLRDVASNYGFSRVVWAGLSSTDSPSNPNGVRPAFCIKA